ncbi:PaaI family thioesterase [Roseivivax jejudonensis]|nr:PaaI family thioesterase [Roseivivax jejudonensis]
MMATLGARMMSCADGACEITAPILDLAMQQHGFGHAGLAFSLGDSAMGYAALSLLPEDREVVTSEVKTNLLAPARGDGLVARGRVVKPGRRLIVTLAEVFAQQGDREVAVALLTGTMVPVDP